MNDQLISRARELFAYDPVSGIFHWRVNRGQTVKVGDEAGYAHRNGRWMLRLDDKAYYAHRVAWAMTYGRWPREIDHIDGNPLNNHINNLREVSRLQNVWNSRGRKDNVLGIKGVSRRKFKTCVRFIARLKIDGKEWARYFATLDEAIIARRRAAMTLQGEFYRQ